MLGKQEPSDQGLVRRALEGDRDAYGLLVKRYLQVVHAVIFTRLGSHADAEDLVQDTFLKAYQSLDTLKNPARFAPWLITIARNQSIALIRKRNRAATLNRRIETPENVPPVDPAKQEMHEVLHKQIMALSEDSREALLLHYFAGKTNREIAVLLGISKSGVQRRVARAREALGKNLVKDIGAEFLTEQSKTCRQKTILTLIASSSVAWNPATHAATLKTLTTFGGLLAMKKALIGSAFVLGMLMMGYLALHRDTQKIETVQQDHGLASEAAPVATTVEDERIADISPDTPKVQDLGPIAVTSTLEPLEIADPSHYCSISGSVVDEAGGAVGGAEVIVTSQGIDEDEGVDDMREWSERAMKKNHHFRATTDPAGNYTVPGIRFRGETNIYASIGGFAHGSTNVTLNEGDSVEGVDIVVESSESFIGLLVGRVISPNGSLVTDGVIRTTGRRSGFAYTNEWGLFEMTSRLTGPRGLGVSVHSPTYGVASFSDLPINADEIIELRMPGVALLRGQVVWADGVPAEGLQVRLQGVMVATWGYREDGTQIPGASLIDMNYVVSVDNSGLYEIQGIDVGQYYSKVTVEDETGIEYANKRLGFLQPNVDTVWNAELSDIGIVYGLVRGEQSGAPIRNGDLTVRALYEGRVVGREAVEDDGSYLFRLPPTSGSYHICLSFEPFGHVGPERYAREVHVEPGDEKEMDMTFMERYTLPIRVIDKNGIPVQNAEVYRRGPRGTIRAGLTDEEGRLVCSELMPGFNGVEILTSLNVRHPDFFEGRTSARTGQPGAVYPEETVVMYRAASIIGRVVDIDGLPIVGGIVNVTMVYDEDLVESIQLHTDSNGIFRATDSVPATTVAFDVRARLDGMPVDQRWEFPPVYCPPGDIIDLGELIFNPHVDDLSEDNEANN